MIVEWLLDALEALVRWFAGLLPGSTVTDPSGGWGGVLGHMADINYYLPLTELFAFTVAFFAGLIPLATVTLIIWVAAFIRGGSARG